MVQTNDLNFFKRDITILKDVTVHNHTRAGTIWTLRDLDVDVVLVFTVPTMKFQKLTRLLENLSSEESETKENRKG